MKKIIICEGRNDKFLIENTLKKIGFSDDDFKFFDIQKLKPSDRKYAESNAIRSFTEINPYNTRKFLIKSEGGKGFAVKTFRTELIKFLSHLDNSILILDNDLGEISQKIDLLKKTIEKHYSQTNPLTLTHQEKKKTQHLHHFSINVGLENENLGDFQIILFEKSLEHSCSILDGDSEEEVIKKIVKFIDSEKVTDFFSPIIS
jgi:hypothetical protein